MDLEFLDEVWDENKVMAMLFGRSAIDGAPTEGRESVSLDSGGRGPEFIESLDGLIDIPKQSWYQMRCAAYDRGDVSVVHDAMQFEGAVNMIPGHRDRAAVILAMWGWDFADIGAALGGRGVNRTGKQMVMSGVRAVVKIERRKREMADGQ